MSRMFQVYEDDLQRLEYAVPKIMERVMPMLNDAELQVLFEECRDILTNVRWGYGPPRSVEVIPARGPE